jgi:putative restriction endonuclease
LVEPMPIKLDTEIRLAAFEWLKSRQVEYGDVLPRQLLSQGFIHKGQRVPLVGPQGIFKPKIIPEIPLSITTSPKSPYDDSFGNDGFLLYRYRGTNPQHHENVGLRKAYSRHTPLRKKRGQGSTFDNIKF